MIDFFTKQRRIKWPLAARLTLALAALVSVICGLVRTSLGFSGRGGYDEINFHFHAIFKFAADWPYLDFSDYLSATTPGFHVLAAFISRHLGYEYVSVFGSIVTAMLFAIAAAYFAATLCVRRTDDGSYVVSPRDVLPGLLVALPLACSPYVLSSGIWVLPDNLAWLLVLLVLRFSIAGIFLRTYLYRAAIVLVLLVSVRQIHLWAAAPIVVAAYCSFRSRLEPAPEFSRDDQPSFELLDLPLRNFKSRIPLTLLAALLTLPSLLLLYYFINLWGGLTPPTFQGQYPVDATKPLLLRLFNAPAAPAFTLALFGVFGVFYSGFWFPAFIKSLKTRGVFPLLISAIVLALLFAIIPATTESIPLGRWSGLWQFTSKLPIIAGHTSTLILSLALLGAVTLCGFLTSMRASHAVVCLTAIAGFAAAQAASFQLWQRYNEPFILMMLILMTTIIVGQREEKPAPLAPLLSLIHRLRFAGPAILAIALGALSYTTFKNAKPSEFFDLVPGTDRTRAFLKGDESIKPVPLPILKP